MNGGDNEHECVFTKQTWLHVTVSIDKCTRWHNQAEEEILLAALFALCSMASPFSGATCEWQVCFPALMHTFALAAER